MGALRLALAALLLGFAAPAAAQSIARWRPIVAEASARFGIPIAWIERVMQAESGGRTMRDGRPITSAVGAMGLMQIMPATWAELRGRLELGTDPHDPQDNIIAGTAYLRRMYDRFGYPGLFAAYNAGPGRYAAHLSTGRPLPDETRAYLRTVGAVPAPAERRRSGIFFTLPVEQESKAEPVDAVGALFAIRRDAPAGGE